MEMNNRSGNRATQRTPVENIENIDAILGKFSAWSVSHAASTKGRSPVSEVSYEQALKATSFRRISPQPLAKTVAVASELSPVEDLAPKLPRRKSSKPAPATATEKKAERTRSSARKSARRSCVREESVAVEPAKGVGLRRVVPTFAEVVARQTEKIPSEVSLRARSVSLSVRLAPAECALVKARAVEARISVSAYIRQCALEVDLLRAEVEKALLEFRAANPVSKPIALVLPAAEERTPVESNWIVPRNWLRLGLNFIRSMRGRRHFKGIA